MLKDITLIQEVICEYLLDEVLCQTFAKQNEEFILSKILKCLFFMYLTMLHEKRRKYSMIDFFYYQWYGNIF